MNILIIKTGALGDVVRTSFLAQALSDKYRNENPKIFWITDAKAMAFFLNNPYVCSVISREDKNKIKNIFFDLIINLEEDEENAKFVSSLKHKRITGVFLNKSEKIDYTPESSAWFDMSMISKFEKEKADILKFENKKTHRELMAEMIGILPEKYEPFLRLNESQRRISNNFLRRHNFSRTDLIIGINTGSADRWPKSLSVKKTVDLIDNIYKKYNAKILLFGGPNEIERNKEIIQFSNSPIIDTGCGNDLIEFPALVGICSIFITTDSLGLHISLALKRKTICLIGPTSNSEIDLYGFGKKIIAKSKCICCYKKDCESMEKIDVKEILQDLDALMKNKTTILITSFNEPNIEKSIEASLKQKTKYDYDVIVSTPDEKTIDLIKKYSEKNKKINFLKDPGKGKSFALNFAFNVIESDILILTDGDVILGDCVVEEICNLFLDPGIGCVSGKPVPLENKETKYGYWANFLFDSAHKIRKKLSESNRFVECTGYLFAFRKNKIKKIPVDVAEDTLIPYFLWQKGYHIGYADKAEVFVKNVNNLKDWIKQKKRTVKSHEKLYKYVDIKTTPRIKNFKNEARGVLWLLKYPKNLREFFWSFQLAILRAYIWGMATLDFKLKKVEYQDAWEKAESTK